VTDVRETLARLRVEDARWSGVEPVWGEAFACDIARQVVDAVEIELIQPVGESFLRNALCQRGEGVQHASFFVDQLESSLHGLIPRHGEMLHPRIVQGLHGQIAFVRLTALPSVDVELCGGSDRTTRRGNPR
jgi:hypothetical protein